MTRSVVSVRLNTDELDAQCARLKVSRTQLLRLALEAYLSPSVVSYPSTATNATAAYATSFVLTGPRVAF